jgi:uncharacterized protein DUF1440
MERIISDSRDQDRRTAVLPRQSEATRLLGLAVIGFTGGVLGSLAMNMYARVARAANQGREADGATAGADRDGRGMQPAQAEDRAEKDAAVRVGSAAYQTVVGSEPDSATERWLGTLAHYAFGASAGAIYAIASDSLPALRKGFGSFYGGLIWAIADEGVVPALGLSRSPRQIPVGVHAYSLSGHCVYGMTLECVRRLATSARERY